MPNIDRRYLWPALVVVLLIVFVGGMKYADLKQEKPTPEIIVPGAADGSSARSEEAEIQVYVAGEVEKPGLYKLKPGARVYEALQMAGVLPSADLKNVHPARKLQDGETIEVLAEGQNPADTLSAQSVSSTTMPTEVSSLVNSGAQININTASVQELDDRLPGIGPTLAQRIIDYRTSNGPFTSIDDINNVSGIGDKKFADIKSLITVR